MIALLVATLNWMGATLYLPDEPLSLVPDQDLTAELPAALTQPVGDHPRCMRHAR